MLNTLRHRLAATVLCAVVSVSVFPEGMIAATPLPQQKQAFADVASDSWFTNAVTEFGAKGYLDTTQARFRPQADATRAELVKMILRLKGIGDGADTVSSFTDVSQGSWYVSLFEQAAKKGWFKGDKDCYGSKECTARPNGTVTRAEAAAMAVRAFGLSATKESPRFADNPDGAWYYGVVQTAADRCILRGDDRGEVAFTMHASGPVVRPASPINRAEMVAMLSRISKNLRYGKGCTDDGSSAEMPSLYAYSALKLNSSSARVIAPSTPVFPAPLSVRVPLNTGFPSPISRRHTLLSEYAASGER